MTSSVWKFFLHFVLHIDRELVPAAILFLVEIFYGPQRYSGLRLFVSEW